DLRDGQAAHTALAGPHAAAAERFGLVGPCAAERRLLPDFARGYLFTAADDGFVGRNAEFVAGAVLRIEEGADGVVILDLPAQPVGLTGDGLVRRGAQVPDRAQGGEFALQRRHECAAD